MNRSISSRDEEPLPLVLCGPIVRRFTQAKFWLWILCSAETNIQLTAYAGESDADKQGLSRGRIIGVGESRGTRIGARAFVHLVEVKFEKQVFGSGENVNGPTHVLYELMADDGSGKWTPALTDDDLSMRCLSGMDGLGFLVPNFDQKRETRIASTSCRKIEGSSSSAGASMLTSKIWEDVKLRPHALLLMGDQLYADDLDDDTYNRCKTLSQRVFGNLPRDELFASFDAEKRKKFVEKELTASIGFFGFSPDPERHLLKASEFLTLYLLYWSTRMWAFSGEQLDSDSDTLRSCRFFQMVFANTVTYFISDDHEVTDDFRFDAVLLQNEKSSRNLQRFACNATLAYLTFQALGNDPECFGAFEDSLSMASRMCSGLLKSAKEADALDVEILKWYQWSYNIPGALAMLVLDSRLARSADPNSQKTKVSQINVAGLAKRLPILSSRIFNRSELDRCLKLIGRTDSEGRVFLVTPTPVFGEVSVEKQIRGRVEDRNDALKYDYENWKSNPRNFRSLLQAVSDIPSCRRLIVISGDVHYAFHATGSVQTQRGQLEIRQVCASAFSNSIPSIGQFFLSTSRPNEEYCSLYWAKYDDTWTVLLGEQLELKEVNALNAKFGTPTIRETVRYIEINYDRKKSIWFGSNVSLISAGPRGAKSDIISLNDKSRLSVVNSMTL